MGYFSHGNSIQAYTTGVGPVHSLTAATSTSATSTALDAATIRQNAVLVVTTGAGVSAGDVELQASLDGTNFWTVGSALAVSAANTTYSQTSTSAFGRYFRAVVSTNITGGSVDAWVGASG
jgi:hypothetical protein